MNICNHLQQRNSGRGEGIEPLEDGHDLEWQDYAMQIAGTDSVQRLSADILAGSAKPTELGGDHTQNRRENCAGCSLEQQGFDNNLIHQ